MMIWEIELWEREGEDARNIIVENLSEISDIIEKYKKNERIVKEGRVNSEEDFGDDLL